MAVLPPVDPKSPQPLGPLGPRSPFAGDEKKNERAYWEGKATLDFRRNAAMAALKAASICVAAVIESGTEKMTADEAIGAVLKHQTRIAQAVFSGLELPVDDGSDILPF